MKSLNLNGISYPDARPTWRRFTTDVIQTEPDVLRALAEAIKERARYDALIQELRRRLTAEPASPDRRDQLWALAEALDHASELLASAPIAALGAAEIRSFIEYLAIDGRDAFEAVQRFVSAILRDLAAVPGYGRYVLLRWDEDALTASDGTVFRLWSAPAPKSASADGDRANAAHQAHTRPCCCFSALGSAHTCCPGWGHFNVATPREGIQRCDECDLYPTDQEASKAHDAHCLCGMGVERPARRCHRCRAPLSTDRCGVQELDHRILCGSCVNGE